MGSETLKKNFQKYFEWAEKAFNQSEWNVAVTLYFKALVEICDWYLWERKRKIGVTHTERFTLLKRYSPELYKIASPMFDIYRDTYTKEISEKVACLVRNDVKKAIKISGIE